MKYNVIIIGAGAAGLMCAIEAGKRGRKVLLLDHAQNVGEKIRISGGGRCNFTNIHASPANYISQNPKFCISALSRYTQHDFLALIKKHNIAYHEKTLGQLFCDTSSKEIIDMLLQECRDAGVRIQTDAKVDAVEKSTEFSIKTSVGDFSSESLVIATGGLSIPKMGATGFGYNIAKQFGLNIISQKAALVPFTLNPEMLHDLSTLAGVSLDVTATCNKQTFKEAMLFTHRGLSGPAILQISSYWNDGDVVTLNLAPQINALERLKQLRETSPKQELHNTLSTMLPKRLAQYIAYKTGEQTKLAEMSNKQLEKIAAHINNWQIVPSGTEGYRTAEVTRGGVDTAELSSKTFEATKVSGLYFIGEVVDVTGHLGGFNFQWAWSSGFAAGAVV
jgi:predicted Rossmann fold flavoprotein